MILVVIDSMKDVTGKSNQKTRKYCTCSSSIDAETRKMRETSFEQLDLQELFTYKIVRTTWNWEISSSHGGE
jgi:hypothetical protein